MDSNPSPSAFQMATEADVFHYAINTKKIKLPSVSHTQTSRESTHALHI